MPQNSRITAAPHTGYDLESWGAVFTYSLQFLPSHFCSILRDLIFQPNFIMYINAQPLLIADVQEPKLLSSWIHHEESLTDQLENIKGSIQLEVLSQNWVNPNYWDRSVLKIKDEQIFQREIMMRSMGIEYWYARTLIPQKCYEQNPLFFKRLENESVRNLIFGTQEVHRVRMDCYPIDQNSIEFYWVKKHLKQLTGIVWVRCAEYSFENKETFYLMELLLPELGRIQ